MKHIKYEEWYVLPNDLRMQMMHLQPNIQCAEEALSAYEEARLSKSPELEQCKRRLYDALTIVEIGVPCFVP